MSLVVNFLGNDLSRYLAERPIEKIGLSTTNFVDELSTVKLLNKGGAFSLDNEKSMIGNIDVVGEKISIVNDSETSLDVVVVKTNTTKNLYTITAQSKLAQLFNQNVAYTALNTDPATAALAILTQAGFTDIDYNSFNSSASIYQDNGVSINVVYWAVDGITVKRAIDDLMQMGSAYMWRQDNKLYFQTFYTYTGNSLYEIGDKDMFDQPKTVTKGQETVFNDYSLNYILSGNVPLTDGTGSQYGRATQGLYERKTWTMNYGAESAIQIITGGHYLGGLRMLRDRYLKRRIQFRIRKNKLPLYLYDTYKITSTIQGWDNVNARLMSLSQDYEIATCTFEELR